MSGKRITVAFTGASGMIFGRRLLEVLDRDSRVNQVDFVPSENSLRVLAEELDIKGRSDLVAKLVGNSSEKIRQYAESDIGAGIASGSYPSDAMVVLPASMSTLAGIAHGLASNLIERAADVSLKEGRPLVLCVRETPLHTIHLRNMLQAAEAGAVIFPIIPTLYNRPTGLGEIVAQFVDRVLARIGLPQPGAYVWKG